MAALMRGFYEIATTDPKWGRRIVALIRPSAEKPCTDPALGGEAVH
ncbi:hypothetical protein OG884_23625 [Streptosporangium sp. NBC_01755]|nr:MULTISPECIES: hypothetical protein [unclassified Streptosporangium]WSA24054.1 hypothetical protein OIE13_24300 [Streptosporangium sp. NBC_01810]WSC97874.1 hypothetical protein OG884_23625 [Streptosporangium sp. NBC_01755]